MAFHTELSAGRKVGLNMHEAFISACKAQDDTFDLAMSGDKPLVTSGLRMVGGVSA